MIDHSLFLCILTLDTSQLITMKNTTLLTLLTLTLCVFGVEKEDKEKNIAASALTEAAWRANLKRKPEEILKQTEKCIKLYEKEALKMQKTLKAPISTGGNQGLNREAVQTQWALNEVGTCYFLQGKAYEQLKKPKLALESYRILVNELPYAQCWDPGGWFWKPAKAAQKRITALENKNP